VIASQQIRYATYKVQNEKARRLDPHQLVLQYHRRGGCIVTVEGPSTEGIICLGTFLFVTAAKEYIAALDRWISSLPGAEWTSDHDDDPGQYTYAKFAKAARRYLSRLPTVLREAPA
jgi:hypothetical protein